jgi:hypothetical protein
MPKTSFIERLRGPAPDLKAQDLRSARWLRGYARRVLVSTDAVLFLVSGVATALVSEHFRRVEIDGEGILLALTAVGFAALAVALTALAIFVSLVNDAYLRILDMSKKGGLAGYVVPFLAAALISSVTTMFGAGGALAYGAFSDPWAKAVILGFEVGFVFWATWSVFRLVVEVAVHGLNRYQIAQSLQQGKMAEIKDIVRKAPKSEGGQ